MENIGRQLGLGMYNEAIAELQKANELSGGDTTCTAVLAYARMLPQATKMKQSGC